MGDPRRIVRTEAGWGLLEHEGEGGVLALEHPLVELLGGAPLQTTGERISGRLLAPVDRQQVWAAGVTYERSLRGREEESREPDAYGRVYVAKRPELFFKAAADQVVGPEDEAGVRADSTWDVPEPELVAVVAPDGSVFGYSIGDDVSSRSIEGENLLYLPQAKVYERSCVLGPWIVPAGDIDPAHLGIAMRVLRGGSVVFSGETSSAKMRRSPEELAGWLGCAMELREGAMLMTGTGIVPGAEFSLRAGDRVEIEIEGIGTLAHGVRTVGREVSCEPSGGTGRGR